MRWLLEAHRRRQGGLGGPAPGAACRRHLPRAFGAPAAQLIHPPPAAAFPPLQKTPKSTKKVATEAVTVTPKATRPRASRCAAGVDWLGSGAVGLFVWQPAFPAAAVGAATGGLPATAV